MRVLHIVGARPNFMKVAPVYAALKNREAVEQVLVHTGQHYDVNMSDVFFQQLGIPQPHVNLQVGSGTHAWQTAQIMMRFEPIVVEANPDFVLVYGDVNSTVAAALVCSKLGIKVGHVEAGLRSFDRTMPEEVNRLVTDQLADLLFTPSQDGDTNLLREGVAAEKIHFVGNVMIDTLLRLLPAAEQSVPKDIPERFVLVTLHRPSNVDDTTWLEAAMRTLTEINRELPVIFPIHPRTRSKLREMNFSPPSSGQFKLLDALPYVEFLGLLRRATCVITDSGGLQEETTYLRIPCITMRENTERPITITLGTNQLIGRDVGRLPQAISNILARPGPYGEIPPLWDGCASERIAQVLIEKYRHHKR